MNKENEGLKFLSIDITNFKNISKKQIDIGGKSLFVIGANGTGKSSFLDALLSPLNTKVIPTKPIKEGEERSQIEVVIGGTLNGESKKYVLDLFFSPANQKGRLVVYNEIGEQIKAPATLIKSIVGQIGFDIYEFLNDKKENKIKTLKQLSGKGKEIDLATLAINGKKEERKILKSKIEDMEASMKNHGFSSEEIEKYSTPVDLSPIQKELSEIGVAIDNYSKVENGIRERQKSIQDAEREIEKSIGEIEEAEEKIKELQEAMVYYKNNIDAKNIQINLFKQDIDKGNAWLSKNTKPSAEEVSKRLTYASLHNSNVSKVEEFAKKQKNLIKAKQDLQTLGINIEKEETNRQKIIASSQLPIKGLSFSDEEILYNNLPLESEQINTATLLDIGVEIAMALNPNLRVIFLKEGSMFDNDSLRALVKKVEQRGYQIIIEYVSPSGGDLHVDFIESEVK